jgi:DNA-binding GntR family transcriptional regulator
MQLYENLKLNSKKEFAYQKIKEKILNNILKPGTILNERELCDDLNISRTPIREALLKLANDGLIEILPNRGAFVSNITYEMITESYSIREVLEGLAARLFCICATDEEINDLQEKLFLLEESYRNNDIENFVKYDKEFHNIILIGSKNKKLKGIMENIKNQVERITNLTKKDFKRAEITLDHHKKIFAEIQKHNPVEAENLMKIHINDSKEYHIKNLKYLIGKL